MKNLILILIAALAPKLSLAAITTDFDCKDESGASIYWEAQPVFEENGEVKREQLYRNHMRVSVGTDEVVFEPQNVVMGKLGKAQIHASSKDGQYVLASALTKVGEEGGGEVLLFTGTVEFKLKTSTGKLIKRAKGTKIKCRVYGEA